MLDGRHDGHLEKSILSMVYWAERPTDSNLGRKYRGNLYIKNSYGHSDRKSKMVAAILKTYFVACLPNGKASWLETW